MIEKIKEAGFDGYLIKPARRSSIAQMINNIYDGAQNKKTVKTIANEHKLFSANILLVEDNIVNQKLASKLLQKAGHKVTIANHGQEALDIIQANDIPIELIFMDMQMPVLNGIDTTKALRKHGNTLAIIAMTANAFEEDRRNCMAAGMTDFIAKPIKRQLVYDMMSKYLGQVNKPIDELRILIIEDEVPMAKLLKKGLSKSLIGSTIHIAHDGVEACASLGSFLPHIIVTDVMMPNMDGFQVIKFLKSEERYQDIKVIAVSALAEADPKIQGLLKLGIECFMEKPYKLIEMLNRVKACL